jgi:hypothetical protein
MFFGTRSNWLRPTALICVAALVPGDLPLRAQQAAQTPPADAGQADAPKKSPEQLDSLVAPIALYPDPLLAQILAASTYPLEVVQANRWLKENSKLTGEKLTQAAAKQPWDPSVQALVAFPSVLKQMDEAVQWTTDMGNAFLDQQPDVMDAVQRMRKKAYDAKKLTSSKEQKVEVKQVETKTVIEVIPSDPQVVYVPSYNPTVVYGPPPPVAPYPPYPYGAVAATAAISFGVGVAMGAVWGGCCGGGGYGWGCSWGNNNVTINNNFNNRYGYSNTNINGGNRTNIGNGNSSWSHNASHRRSVPYGNGSTAQRFGGTARDSSGRTQRFDRNNQQRAGGNDRAGNNRGGDGLGGDRGRNNAGADRQGAGADRGNNRGGGDRMGNRSIDNGGRQNGFGGSGSGARSQAASDRGFASERQSRGGGGGGGGSSGRSAPSRSSSSSRSSGGRRR